MKQISFLQEVLAKPMTRKDFLKGTGLLLLGCIGIGSILRQLHIIKGSPFTVDNPPKSLYGGKKK